MRRSGTMVLSVFLFAQPVMAGQRVIALPDRVDTIVIPASSSLHFRSIAKDNTVKFSGPVEVSGTYYYGDNVIEDGSPTAVPMLYFVLDKQSLARLPRFGTRGQPGELYFTNETDLTKAIVPPADAKAAAHKGGKYASGKADIWVDHFEAGIECDAPNFTAHFLSVAHPPMRVALATQPDVGC